MTFTTSWTEEALQKAKDLWIAGEHAETISAALGGEYSADAIYAKMRRDKIVREVRAKSLTPHRKKEVTDEDIFDMHLDGYVPGEIARRFGVRVAHVADRLAFKGVDPRGNRATHYMVHPMWSLPEDERREAFKAKEAEGWAEVQERLKGK